LDEIREIVEACDSILRLIPVGVGCSFRGVIVRVDT
jgi:hypothetical protein